MKIETAENEKMRSVSGTEKTFPKSKVLLAGTADHALTPSETMESLAELKELVSTLGCETVGMISAVVRESNPRFYVGSGKAEEIRDLAREKGAGQIVFDVEMSPSQQRNLERLCGVPVIDRQEVILDIFAARARTREAVLQVELARYRYFLPRLTKAWSHLSRQHGGANGTRGEGEKQIETDRREVKMQIAKLEAELAVVRRQRTEQRKSRKRNTVTTAAIVGYTNAGKSSLLNLLTGADAYVENKLFATLDPTTRRLVLPDKSELLLTDTVGFVRRLPHQLVEAFKSTLEEAVLADFLVIVLDVSNPEAEEHWAATMKVLEELGALGKPVLTVFNKCDLETDPLRMNRLRSASPDAIAVSCRTGEGIPALLEAFRLHLRKNSSIRELLIPPCRGDLIAALHSGGAILESCYLEDGSFSCAARLSDSQSEKFTGYFKKMNPAENMEVCVK